MGEQQSWFYRLSPEARVGIICLLLNAVALFFFSGSRDEFSPAGQSTLILLAFELAIAMGVSAFIVVKGRSSSWIWLSVAAINAVAAVLLGSATAYFWTGDTSNWNITLTHLDALYVAMGTFTTAGTSGITPISEHGRALVIVQMSVDVVVSVLVLGIFASRLTRLAVKP